MKLLPFYKFATWGLLLLNLSMVAFFFLTRPKPPQRDPGRDFAKRAVVLLQLEEAQHHTFLASARQHDQQMEALSKQQRSLLQPYFYTLIDPAQPIDTTAILDQVQQLERSKIDATYQHFAQVKAMLNEKQKAGFELFMNSALGIILLDPKKRPRPPQGF